MASRKSPNVTIELITKLVDEGFRDAEKLIKSQQKLEEKLHKKRILANAQQFINAKKSSRNFKKSLEKKKLLQEQYAIKEQQFAKRLAAVRLQESRAIYARGKKSDAKLAKDRKKYAQELKQQKKKEATFIIKKIKEIQRASEKAIAERKKKRIKSEKETAKKIARINKRALKGFGGMATGLKRATDASQSLSNGLMRVGGIALSIVGTFGALASKIIETGAGFEQSIRNVGTILKVTDPDLISIRTQKLADRARKLGSTTAYTASEVATGMADLARAGLKSQKIISAIGPALYLAGGAGVELSAATKLMARTFAQFNLNAEDASAVADTFTLAMQNSLLNMQSLDSSMRYAGSAAGSFGWDIHQTAAAVSVFMDQTGLGSTAGTQFRHVMNSLRAPTYKAQKYIERLAKAQGVSASIIRQRLNPATSDFKQIMETLKPIMLDDSALTALVNKRSVATLQKVLKDYHSGVSKYDDLMDKFKTGQDRARATYEAQIDTVTGQSKIVRSQIQEIFLQIFDAINPALREGLSAFKDMFQSTIEVLKLFIIDIEIAFSDFFRSSMQGAEGLGGSIRNMGRKFAIIIVVVLKSVAKIPKALQKVFNSLKSILKMVLTIWLASKFSMLLVGIAAIGKAVISLSTIILAALVKVGFAAEALAVKIAAATAGISLIITGLYMAYNFLNKQVDTGVGVFDNVKEEIDSTMESMDEMIAKREAVERIFREPIKTLFGDPDLDDSEAAKKHQDHMAQVYDSLLQRQKAAPAADKKTYDVALSNLQSSLQMTGESLSEGLKTGELVEVGSKLVEDLVGKHNQQLLLSLNNGEKYAASINTIGKILETQGKTAADSFAENADKMIEATSKQVRSLDLSNKAIKGNLPLFQDLTSEARKANEDINKLNIDRLNQIAEGAISSARSWSLFPDDVTSEDQKYAAKVKQLQKDLVIKPDEKGIFGKETLQKELNALLETIALMEGAGHLNQKELEEYIDIVKKYAFFLSNFNADMKTNQQESIDASTGQSTIITNTVKAQKELTKATKDMKAPLSTAITGIITYKQNVASALASWLAIKKTTALTGGKLPLEDDEKNKAYINKLKAFYKKLEKMERDSAKRLRKIRSDDTDKYVSDLNERLQKLQDFFRDSLSLFRHNSKRQLAVIKRFNKLREQERLIALEKVKKDLDKRNQKIQDELDEYDLDPLQKKLRAQQKEIQELSKLDTGVAFLIAQAGVGELVKELDELGAKFTSLSGKAKQVKGFNIRPQLKDYQKYFDEVRTIENKILAFQKKGNKQGVADLQKTRDEKLKELNEIKKNIDDFIKNLNQGKTSFTVGGYQFKIPKAQRAKVLKDLKETQQLMQKMNEKSAAVAEESEKALVEFTTDQGEFITKKKLLHLMQIADYIDKEYNPKMIKLEEDLQKAKGQVALHAVRELILNEQEELQKRGITDVKLIQKMYAKYYPLLLQETKNFGKELNKINSDSTIRERDLIGKSLEARLNAAKLEKKATLLERKNANETKIERVKNKAQEQTALADYYTKLFELEEKQRKELTDIAAISNLVNKDNMYNLDQLHVKYVQLRDILFELQTQRIDALKSGDVEEQEKLENSINHTRAQANLLKEAIDVLSIAFKRHEIDKKKIIKPKAQVEGFEKLKQKAKEFFEYISPALGFLKKSLDFIRNVIGKIQEGINFMTGGRLKLNPFELMTEAANELLAKQDEFIQKQKDLKNEFKAGRITKDEYTSGVKAFAEERGNAAQIAKELVDNMIEESLRFMDALVEVAPIIIQRLIDRLPKITAALEQMIPQLVLIIDKLFPAFVPVLTKMFTLAAQVFAKVVTSILFKDRTAVGSKGGAGMGSVTGGLIGGMAGGPLGYLLGAGLGGLIGGVFGDTPNPIKVRSQAGMLARFAHGDTVIAAKEPQELLRQALQAVGSEVKMATRRPPAPPTRNTGNSSGGAKIDIAVIAEGRVLDAVQMQALERGHAPKIAKRLRKASGVKVGFNRGRYNKFAVNEN